MGNSKRCLLDGFHTVSKLPWCLAVMSLKVKQKYLTTVTIILVMKMIPKQK